MTTDRTALEAARDALPPLPEPMTYLAPDGAHGKWGEASSGVAAFDDDQMRDYAAQAVTAALSSPPVLPAEPVAMMECVPMGEPQLAWLRPAFRLPFGTHKLYAAPQSAAPALDDARDADKKRLDWLEQSEARNQWIVAKGAGSFTVSPGRQQHATRKTIREAIDAAMQQEPRS